jgi:hypothetical protein
MEWIPEIFFQGKSFQEHESTQLHLVPRIGMHGANPPLPHVPSFGGAKKRV